MAPLILTEDQARLLTEAGCNLPLVDPRGKTIGMATPPLFTDEEIAEAKRRLASDQPRYTTAEMLERLEQLAPSPGHAS